MTKRPARTHATVVRAGALGAALAALAACGAPPPPPPPPPVAAPEPPPPPPPAPEPTAEEPAPPPEPESTTPKPSGRPPVVVMGAEKVADTFGATPSAKLELGNEGANFRIPEYALGDGVLITFSLDKKGKKTKGAAGQIYRLMAQQPPSEEARTITTKGGPFTLRLPDAKLSPANLAIGEPKKDDKGRDTVEWKIIAPKSTEPGFVIFEINEFTNPYMHVTSEPPTGG